MSAIQCSKCTFEEWNNFGFVDNIGMQRGIMGGEFNISLCRMVGM